MSSQVNAQDALGLPLVTVAIATYNRAHIVCEAIDSVLHQTYPRIELVVVDDGSTDSTQSVLNQYGDAIRVIYQPNQGPAGAWNTGVKASSGSLISFLGSDDLWLPNFVEDMVRLLESFSPQIGGVFCDCECLVAGRRVPSLLRLCPKFAKVLDHAVDSGGVAFFPQTAIYRCLLEEMPVKQQAVILRRSEVEKNGTFQASWRSGEDWEFLLGYARRNDFACLDRPLVIVRTQEDSTFRRYKTEDAHNLFYRFIEEKHTLTDGECIQAVRRGIAHHARTLGWQYIYEGRRREAARTYLRGFAESRDVSLFARSIAAFLPQGLRSAIRSIKHGHHG